jgi:hypothetical protein
MLDLLMRFLFPPKRAQLRALRLTQADVPPGGITTEWR